MGIAPYLKTRTFLHLHSFFRRSNADVLRLHEKVGCYFPFDRVRVRVKKKKFSHSNYVPVRTMHVGKINPRVEQDQKSIRTERCILRDRPLSNLTVIIVLTSGNQSREIT